jgi:hypothetical protein
VAAHGYFGRLIFQYASFTNSRSMYFFCAARPVVGIWFISMCISEGRVVNTWADVLNRANLGIEVMHPFQMWSNAGLKWANKFGQEEETYNIVAAHGYFGRLILQYASFNNSRFDVLLLCRATQLGASTGLKATAESQQSFLAGRPARCDHNRSYLLGFASRPKVFTGSKYLVRVPPYKSCPPRKWLE